MSTATTSPGTNRVFWSGGEATKGAADTWAAAHGATTLAMTPEGARLAATTPGLGWITRARRLWIQASARFASGATGDVHVFQDHGASPRSIWRTVEYPVLLRNPHVGRIIFH